MRREECDLEHVLRRWMGIRDVSWPEHVVSAATASLARAWRAGVVADDDARAQQIDQLVNTGSG
jgi:hypothetical protein